jgi:hypothetical protein
MKLFKIGKYPELGVKRFKPLVVDATGGWHQAYAIKYCNDIWSLPINYYIGKCDANQLLDNNCKWVTYVRRHLSAFT